jgi:hypothetical protein
MRYNQTKRGYHPLICVPTTQEYRQLANIHVKPTDNVLEVGSAHGKTTKLLATIAKNVVGIDCDRKMLAASISTYSRPNMSFHYFNALDLNTTDWSAELFPKGVKKFSVVFIDCGGTIPVKNLAPILKAIREGVKPRLIVCKSLNLHKLQVQIMEGLEYLKSNPSLGVSQPNGETQKQQREQPQSVPLAIRRCQIRLWERVENWLSEHPNATCQSILPSPNVVRAAAKKSREDISKMKSWRARAIAGSIDIEILCRCFLCTKENSDEMVVVLLAPGEPFPSKPWNKCNSSTVRKVLSRDDYYAYCKLQMLAPFSHEFPVEKSILLSEYLESNKDLKRRLLIECSPGNYLSFTHPNLNELINKLKRDAVAPGYNMSDCMESNEGDYDGGDSISHSHAFFFGLGVLSALTATYFYSKK